MSDLPDYLTRALPLLLILAFFAQGMTHARHASLTFDEGPHLAVGYATLRTGDLRLQPVHIHPPLANVLAAAPLLFQTDLPEPKEIEGWNVNSLSAVTDSIVWQYSHPRHIAVAGRVPILLLGVLLSALILRWTADLAGASAGILALALYAFDPNFIAHASLITTDMAAVFFSVATLYALRRQTRDTRPKHLWKWAGVGVLLGLAQLAKVSALMLVPVVGLELGIASYGLHTTSWEQRLARFIRRVLGVFVPAGLVVWAGYGFEIGPVPGLTFSVPAATHVKIFLSLRKHYALGHPTFLMGQVSDQGWWWYFPTAFVLKTPLSVLVLGAWCVMRGAWHTIRSRFTFHASHLTLYLFPLLYAIASFFSTVNIGYRHLLPLLPFIHIGIGVSVASLISDSTREKSRVINQLPPVIVFGALAWLWMGTLGIAPHYLAFFNELAGGPDNGYKYLVDSNLDWGQNLWDLQAWMDQNDRGHVYYAHYSPARPQVYGINADFLPPDPRAVDFTPWHPEPGFYAIGATVFQGPYAPDLNTYAWFRTREPTARLGHALFLYDVPSQPAPTWVGTCTHPKTTLPHDVIRQKLNTSELRIFHFDCDQSWAFPDQGAGAYVLPANVDVPSSATRMLKAREPNGTTAYTVYRIENVPQPANEFQIGSEAAPLHFLGYQVDETEARAGETIILKTFWKVERQPERPLSLMAHLVDDEGVPVAIGDGLGVPIDQWRPGDVIVQRHPLSIPPTLSSGQYSIYTGGYWLDNMERWIFEDGKKTVIIGDIHVEK